MNWIDIIRESKTAEWFNKIAEEYNISPEEVEKVYRQHYEGNPAETMSYVKQYFDGKY